MEKLFELRKDIDTPERYIRAGEQKTREEWEKIFPDAFKLSQDTWFIDMSKAKIKTENHIAWEIVNELFAKNGLKSITYKEAAVASIKEYIRQTTKE